MPLINNGIAVFVFCFGLLVIAPVWLFNLAELSFFMKMMFTGAGGVGIYIAVAKGSLGGFGGRR